jgi:hypothetical protein
VLRCIQQGVVWVWRDGEGVPRLLYAYHYLGPGAGGSYITTMFDKCEAYHYHVGLQVLFDVSDGIFTPKSSSSSSERTGNRLEEVCVRSSPLMDTIWEAPLLPTHD